MASKLFFDIFANDKTGQAFSSLQGRLDQSEKRLRAMRNQFAAVAAAAVAFGAAVFSAASRGARQIDEAAKAARRLDASIGGFRALEMAAVEAGVPTSALTDNLQNINRELAKGGTSTIAALDRLGLSAAQLASLDADEKIAVIADRVRELGLSSGEATALLQGLGVRSREMVLLLQGGGDAIRAARSDVEAYGLALSAVDASRIEVANDAIGRLGLIGQYAAQQISLQLTPALGRMAEAMTESLREGGALRAVIDALANNVQRLLGYATAFAVFMGGRYVAALVAARVATFSLVGALGALRIAIIRTGIGALIVGAAELVMWFGRLVRAAGGFGNALSLLKDVAIEAWDRIKAGISTIPMTMAAAAQSMAGHFLGAISDILFSFNQMTTAIAAGLNNLFGLNLNGDVASGAIAAVERASVASFRSSYANRDAANAAWSTAIAPMQSLAALRSALDGVDDDAADASDSLSAINDALEDIGGGGGGGGGGGAAGRAADAMSAMGDRAREAVDSILEAYNAVQERVARGAEAISDSLFSIVSGAKSAKQALGELLLEMAKVQFRNGIMGLSQSGGRLGGILGAIGAAMTPIGANANGTDNWRGGLTRVNERGGEIMNLPRGTQIIPHDVSMRMASQAGRGHSSVRIELGPGLVGSILEQAQGQTFEIVQQAAPGIAQQAHRQTFAQMTRSGQGWR